MQTNKKQRKDRTMLTEIVLRELDFSIVVENKI